MNTLEIFAERLRELRIDKDLSLKQLSDRIGVSDIAISRWENKLRTPNIEYLALLAKFFGVSADYLIGLEN